MSKNHHEKRILIVDDDEEDYFITSQYLSRIHTIHSRLNGPTITAMHCKNWCQTNLMCVSLTIAWASRLV